MAENQPLLVTPAERNMIRALLTSLRNVRGGGGIETQLVPGQSLTISGKTSRSVSDLRAEYGWQVVQVKNNSGGNVSAYDILGIDGPEEAPDPNTDAPFAYPTAKGVKPEDPKHRGRFVVVLADIASGEWGPAMISGAAFCKVDIADEDAANSRAEIAHNQTGFLVATEWGSAGILWREGGTGEQWAVVRLGEVPQFLPYKLTPCSEEDGEEIRYTIDNLKDHVGKVVKIEGLCYTVEIPTDEELKCVEPECGLVIAGSHDTCCDCHGYKKITLTPCDDGEDIEATIVGTIPIVGQVVRIDDACYTVSEVADCDEDEGELLPADLVFDDCATCAGECWEVQLCDGSGSMQIQSPNLTLGDVVQINGQCWTVIGEGDCSGDYTEISAHQAIVFENCDECIDVDFCLTNGCDGRELSTAMGNGATQEEADEAAKATALENAESAAGGRGINVCICDVESYGEAAGVYSAFARVCWLPCCPEGYKQVEVVTDVQCDEENAGDMILTTEKICVVDVESCQEGC